MGLLFLAFSLAAAPAPADAKTSSKKEHAEKQKKTQKTSIKRIQTHIIMDAETGDVLECNNCYDKAPPASLTKVLTAIVGFDAIRSGKISLDGPATPLSEAKKVEANGALTLNRRYGIRPGTPLSLDAIFSAIAVTSAADASITLSKMVCGDANCIVDMMNEKLKVILKDDPSTLAKMSFTNPHGMPDKNQYVTAYGVAKIMQYMVHNYPEESEYFGKTGYKLNGRTIPGHNQLLVDYNRKSLFNPYSCTMEAGKTGYFYKAGSNIVVSARCDGHRVIVVDIGEPSAKARNIKTAALMDKGFDILERSNAPRRLDTKPHLPAILTPHPNVGPEPDAETVNPALAKSPAAEEENLLPENIVYFSPQ